MQNTLLRTTFHHHDHLSLSLSSFGRKREGDMEDCLPSPSKQKPEPSSPHDEPLLPLDRALDLCIRLDINPKRIGSSTGEHVLRARSFRKTVRTLQLDHSSSSRRLLSWLIGVLLLVIIPFFRMYFLKEASNNPNKYKLVYEPLIVVLGFAISTISFIFLSETMRRHGFRGILFIDFAEEESTEIRKEYHNVIEQGWTQLVKMFIPAIIIYTVVKAWLFVNVSLESLPLGIENKTLDLAIIITLTSVSWIFQTTTFLYTCVLFSTVCALQELKMKKYKDQLGEHKDPEFYFQKYEKIIGGLRLISQRFRMFLALAGTITVFGALSSMYEFVQAERAGISLLVSGELIVLNVVNLMGIGLCLKSASKIAHLHRRIVKAACSMHAMETYESPSFNSISSVHGKERQTEFLERMIAFCQFQDAWCRRAAFVSYMSNAGAGISVYGFVLDRFFVHTSIGAILTTTWFILGRSLQGN